jgi:glycosyltransferase involved in cell wall biosynthesis
MEEPARLVLLSAFRFPHGDAMSNRILQLARSARPAGTIALVINDWPCDGSSPPPAVHLPSDVELVTIRAAGKGFASRYLLRLSRPLRIVRAMRAHDIARRDIAAVCLPAGLMSLTTWLVLRTALRCPVVVDALERHDPAQFSKGRLAPYFVRHRWTMFLAVHLANRVIAVSSLLGQHLTQRGAEVMVVPPQVDCDEFAEPAPPPIGTSLRLLYAGTPGTKDKLDVLIEALRQLPAHDQARVELVIAGVDRTQAARLSDLCSPGLADRVTFLGRVPRTRVLDLLSRSHFSVLVRPSEGYADAGFPSKVPESLAAGCPVLLNHTSDLARYIEDGKEGIVLKGYTADDVRRGLETALTLDDPDWHRMSEAARARARQSFDYRSWATAVSGFVAPSRNEAAPSRDISSIVKR